MLALVGMLLGLLVSTAPPDSVLVADAVQAAVAARAGGAAAESVSLARVRFPVAGLPLRLVDCAVTSMPAGRIHGPVTVMVRVTDGTGALSTLPVSCDVRTYGMVASAAGLLARHAVLTEGSVVVKRMETTSLRDGYISSQSSLAGMRTKRIIAEGEVLYAAVCEPVPIVQSGDEVTLESRVNGVVVGMPAVVRQDGGTGDVIAARPVGRHENVSAVVIDAHTIVLKHP
jgi:flagella basal body P-ring formation protein FlgA